MERLTHRTSDGHVGIAGYTPEYDILDRLGDYEDTGLEPAEIKDNLEQLSAYRTACVGLTAEDLDNIITEYTKFKEAEANGWLVVLPCKVGDKEAATDG